MPYIAAKQPAVDTVGIRMLRASLELSARVTATALLAFTFRRLLFSLTVLLSQQRAAPIRIRRTVDASLPGILILVACRNEEKVIPGLCQALSALDYSPYQVILIDDGSNDSTRQLLEQGAAGRTGWHVLALPSNVGKAAALATALDQSAFGDLVYVIDADHRPEPQALSRLARYFDDLQVAGVSGRTIPVNTLASPSAYYSAVENQLHQMVTMRARSRLGLASAMLGSNCAYRRSALLRCGGFRHGVLLEDSDLTISLYEAGYRICFAEDVITYHQVPETIEGYLKQHRRWARGFNDLARHHLPALLCKGHMPLATRIDLLMFALGYLDRAAWLAGVALSLLSYVLKGFFRFPNAVLAIALLTPLAQVVGLFAQQRALPKLWRRLPLLPAFFLIDMWATLQALIDSLFKRQRIWSQTERSTTFEGTR